MAGLEFEKKIEELKHKIEEVKSFSKDQDVDLSLEIDRMMDKLSKLEKEVYKNLTAWDKLALARLLSRPTTIDYIEEIFDFFFEFHGDRGFADDNAIIGGIAELGDIPVTVIGIQKGRNTKENIFRNFGQPNPEGYRKALRLMKEAEKFKRPVICFIDTPGAFCGQGAEERGIGEAIARNLLEMSSLKTPIISILIGEGGSGGALALAVADEVWMLEYSVYSILSPEGFASILWKDASRAKEAAQIMKITSGDLKDYGIIDKVLKEPLGGAQRDAKEMSATIKENLILALKNLKSQEIDTLLENRYKKFRSIGKFIE